jgi:transcriptional regulator with XRE-family HTH domain
MANMLQNRHRVKSAMDSKQFRAIRLELGLTQRQFASAFGFGHKAASMQTRIALMEGGHQPIPERVARLAEMFRQYGVPYQFNMGSFAREAVLV